MATRARPCAPSRAWRATAEADTYAPGPPLGTYRLHVPASRVGYVPEAQGGLPPGPRVLYVRGTRTSLGRTVRTAYRGTPGDSRQLLVVENVVSQHMHVLMGELGGQALPGNRPGARGCNYWVGPPSAREGWQPHELAV